MFEQQKRIGLRAEFDCLFNLFLKCETGGVINEAEPLDQKLSFFVHATTEQSFGVILLEVILAAAPVFGTIRHRRKVE